MQIRSLGTGDARAFHALRLRGLRKCPAAFASSHEEKSGAEIADIAERLGADANRCRDRRRAEQDQQSDAEPRGS